jgi:hypothetical protein
MDGRKKDGGRNEIYLRQGLRSGHVQERGSQNWRSRLLIKRRTGFGFDVT